MKALIFGTGYLGSRIGQKWFLEGYHVTSTTRNESKVLSLKDFSHKVLLLPVTRLESYDVCLVAVAPKNRADYESTYLHTAQLLVESLPKKTKFIVISSTSVYGDHNGEWVDERSPLCKFSKNGQILCDTEKVYLSRSNICILRLGEIVGPGRSISERLKQLDGRPLPGNGEQYTNIIHIDDITSAIDFSWKNDLHGVYNLCSDLHIPRKQLYKQLSSKENFPEPQWDPSLTSPHGGSKKVSSQKIKATGFTFLHPNPILN